MLELPTPPSSQRRPMFAVSVALHLALGTALVVPPLLATPEPPEPSGIERIQFLPTLLTDAPVRRETLLPRKGEGRGGVHSTAPRASDTDVRPPFTRPSAAAEVLPDPTGGESELPFEETGGSREPGNSGDRAGNGDEGTGGGEGGDGILSASSPGVTPPVAIETFAPSYPELARRARIEGIVLLEATIGPDGSVREVRLLHGANALLDPAALEAVRHWRYRPGRIGERPVSVLLHVAVTFSLRNL